MLGFQEGVGAPHTSLLISTNLYIRIVEYPIGQLNCCEYRNNNISFCGKCKISPFHPHFDLTDPKNDQIGLKFLARFFAIHIFLKYILNYYIIRARGSFSLRNKVSLHVLNGPPFSLSFSHANNI